MASGNKVGGKSPWRRWEKPARLSDRVGAGMCVRACVCVYTYDFMTSGGPDALSPL